MRFKTHLNKPNGEKYLCNPNIRQMPVSKSVCENSFLALPAEERCARCNAIYFKNKPNRITKMKRWNYKVTNCNNEIIDSGTVVTGNNGTRITAIRKAKFKSLGNRLNPFVKIDVKFIEFIKQTK